MFVNKKKERKILFASMHNYLDDVSGAAISLRSILCLLARDGWQTRTICGSFFDDATTTFETFCDKLKNEAIPFSLKTVKLKGKKYSLSYRLVSFNDNGIESDAFFINDSIKDHHFWEVSDNKNNVFLYLLKHEFKNNPPSVFMTYGGYPSTSSIAFFFKEHGIKTVFFLCNLAYHNRNLFDYFDKTIVPSSFAKKYYQHRLGIESVVIPPLIEKQNIIAHNHEPIFLTLVNPSLEKGLFFTVELLSNLARKRRDIPILIVRGRASISQLKKAIGDGFGLKIQIFREHVSPLAYYQKTRVLLAPSVCEETFGRIIIEAGMNRIPTVCSSRGAFPETLGSGGLALKIPDHRPLLSTNDLSSEDMEPWLHAIMRLWDDNEHYAKLCEAAWQNALRFQESRIREEITHFFNTLIW